VLAPLQALVKSTASILTSMEDRAHHQTLQEANFSAVCFGKENPRRPKEVRILARLVIRP
jgi:hypothetical protein